ncbi:MAG: carbohydrate porin [Chthoniobacteraceae bacterium]
MYSKNNLLNSVLLAGMALSSIALAGDSAPPEPEPAKCALSLGGLSFPISYTGETIGNVSGGYRRGATYEGLLNIGVQGDLEKLLGWQGGSFLVSGINTHGSSATDKYTRDFNAVSNIDAYDTTRLYEAWFQQDLGPWSIRLGQILADAEFFVSDSSAVFINGAFGAIPLISQNYGAPVYPTAAPGARVRYTFNDAFSVQAGIFDGNAGDQGGDNKYGTYWKWDGNDGALAIVEGAYTTKLGSDGLTGTYKLGAFYFRSDETDLFPKEGRRDSGGGYFIADQQVWREPGAEDQGMSAFLRIGGAPSDRALVPFYFDTGVNYKGLLPGRDGDITGLGFSYTRISSEARNDDGSALEGHHEGILELTYKIQATEWMTVQPDLQYIFNPGATGKQENAFVAGVRFNVSF